MKLAAGMLVAMASGLVGCAPMAPMAPVAPAGPIGPATVSVAEKAPFGPYLVGPDGRSLYILEGTRGASGINRCDGECLRIWPPLHPAGRMIAPGIDARRLSNVRGYGGPHVAYAGWPLYYYHHDRAPGDTTGQHVRDAWGTWHLLSPSGAPIRPGR
jgi:predicted lipoprotein with Yx(FWY)xxD motif